MISIGRRRGPHALLVAFALVGLAGCSGASTVQGTVTLDGAPVDGASIHFTPKEESGAPATGAPIVGGKYTMSGRQGPVPGSYRVDISWKRKTGRQVPTPGDPAIPMDETVEAIPAVYNSASTLSKEVQSGVNTFDFDLKSRPQGPSAPAKGD